MASSFMYAILSVLVMLLLYTQTGSAIHCFVCNSHDQYEGQPCWDLTPSDNKSSLYKDCSHEPEPEGKVFARCRVQLQTVEGETRVIRSCATAEEHHTKTECIDRTGTSKIKLRYCECNTDGCNSAITLTASILTLIGCAWIASALH